MLRTKYIFALALLVPLFLFAQQKGKISQKNNELKQIKNEIAKLEKKIKGFSQKEAITGKELEALEKQIFLYDKLIADLRNQISATEKSIKKLKNRTVATEEKIKRIKKIFERYANFLYKMNEPTVWDYLFDPKGFNENMELRYYFEYFAESAKNKIDSLKDFENQLIATQKEKERQYARLKKLITEKEKQKNKLLLAKKRKNKYLAKLRSDKKQAKRIIENKRKEQEKISALIARLIKEEEEAEKRRMRELAARKKKSKATEEISYNYFSGVKFTSLKGKLPLPVSGKITKHFGKIRNPKLKTISFNNGIDIKTKAGAKVKAVADGIVSAVEWLPGYGPVVIISHGNKFRSVYGYVDDFKVTKGEKVKAGQTLGRVASSINGNVVHFEIWNKRKPENPEKWLKR